MSSGLLVSRDDVSCCLPASAVRQDRQASRGDPCGVHGGPAGDQPPVPGVCEHG